jgi:hypothetical protein
LQSTESLNSLAKHNSQLLHERKRRIVEGVTVKPRKLAFTLVSGDWSALGNLAKAKDADHRTESVALSSKPIPPWTGKTSVILVSILKAREDGVLMRFILLTLLLLASVPTFAQAGDSPQHSGTITGTVLDEHGQPFRGVQVCTYMIGAPSGSEEARGDCQASTDDAGQFHIDHLAMGTFGVEAIKPDQGYIAFAGTSAKQEVTLTLTQSSATVALKLGPRPGVLFPRVEDKSTGEPIKEFEVSWTILDADEASSISGGETISRETGRTVVPPNHYFVLTISARGYKKWIYHEPSNPSRPVFIRFEPGEEKEVLVELEPRAPAIAAR